MNVVQHSLYTVSSSPNGVVFPYSSLGERRGARANKEKKGEKEKKKKEGNK